MLEQIMKLLEKGILPQTMLFAGPKGSGKKAAALKLAAALLQDAREQHPDLHVITPEGSSGMHSIESMRCFIEEIHMAPYLATTKVFILEQADHMLSTSSNALLKTLEEPTQDSTIILISEQPEAILPTILSRARKFVFHKVEKKDLEKTEQRDVLVKLLSQKIPFKERLKLLTVLNEEENQEKILEEILYWYRDRHALKTQVKLHFNAYRKELEACTLPLPPLETLFDHIEKARFALKQHIQLKNCLDPLIGFARD